MSAESNLPPGVGVSGLPGNRPGDAEQEQAWDKLLDSIVDSGLTADEARRRWESQPCLFASLVKVTVLLEHWEKIAVIHRGLSMARRYIKEARRAIKSAQPALVLTAPRGKR